ncbi:MAG: hypothetical protein H0U12_10095 [Thermoleophilaceae bacterium]|nr:hypothetical protein [Thermoleophilaceae bacterium]
MWVSRWGEYRGEVAASYHTPTGESSIEPSTPARRILVLSADLGEGHDAAARALAADLTRERPDSEVAIHDGLVALGPLLHRVIRDGSWFQFRRVPWVFGVVYALLMGFAPVRRASHAVMYRIGGSGLRRLIESHGPDVIVSTYPGVNPVLGRLRRHGLVRVPVCTTVLDLASLEFWAHAGIDLHLVMHSGSSERIAALAGAGRSRCVRPLVAPTFFEARSQLDTRRSFDLPAVGSVILVTGGGWGIGDLDGAVRSALEAGAAAVVCVAGRNAEARERLLLAFGEEPRVRVLGFTDQMRDLIAAADVLVHSGGGVTCLEGLVAGCPTVLYGMPPGHWRANARGMAALGIARVARSARELRAVLEAELEPPPTAPFERSTPSAASLVFEAEGCANGRSETPRLRLRRRDRRLAVGNGGDGRRRGEYARADGQERQRAEEHRPPEWSPVPALTHQHDREGHRRDDVHDEHHGRDPGRWPALEGGHLAYQAHPGGGGRPEHPQGGRAPGAAPEGVGQHLRGDPAPGVREPGADNDGDARPATQAA